MKVCFYATLRQYVPTPRLEWPPGAGLTVRALLQALVTRCPGLDARLLEDDGSLQRQVHVMVNGRDAPYLERGLDTVLEPADRVDIFPPVGGG